MVNAKKSNGLQVIREEDDSSESSSSSSSSNPSEKFGSEYFQENDEIEIKVKDTPLEKQTIVKINEYKIIREEYRKIINSSMFTGFKPTE